MEIAKKVVGSGIKFPQENLFVEPKILRKNSSKLSRKKISAPKLSNKNQEKSEQTIWKMREIMNDNLLINRMNRPTCLIR